MIGGARVTHASYSRSGRHQCNSSPRLKYEQKMQISQVGTEDITSVGGQFSGTQKSSDLPLDNGMSSFAPRLFDCESHYEECHTSHNSLRPHLGSTSKMDFPKFDRDDYQVFLDNYELYFEINGVSDMMTVKFV